MTRPFARLGALVLALAALGFASCGGPTGIELRIDTPPTWVPGVDFNGIYVSATPDGDESQVQGDTYPVSALSPKPYIVYIYADQKQQVHHTMSLRVEVRMNNSIKQTTTLPDIVLKQGQIEFQVADLSKT